MSRAIADVSDSAELFQLVEAEKAKNPAFAAWLAERKLSRYSPPDMGCYADGTLGAAIRNFIETTGYELEFVHKDTEPASDLEYVFKRIGANHDIEHLVTGFGPNTAGEEALAFANIAGNARFLSPELAQVLSASSVFVSTAGYSRVALHYHAVLPAYLDAMQQGIAVGLGVKTPLMLVRWEDYLDWPLEEIAADLGFKRGPEEAWTWTSEAASG
jgi:ubiquinone biosynthesis protein Coq4